MARPTVLMACPHPWGSTFQLGGHHLARAFVVAGWDVAYVSNPISPLHLVRARSPDFRQRAATYRSGGTWDLDRHLWAYVPGALLTPHNLPLLRGGWLQRNWHRLSVPPVTRLVRSQGFESFDLVFLDTVVQPFWLKAIPHRRSVLRIGDRMEAFSAFTPAMRRVQRDLASSADLVVYSATSLAPDVGRLHPRDMLHLPNGVDFNHFAKGDRSLPSDLADIPRPIAIYVGAMDKWFDFAAVDAMAAALPDVSFVLIGPDDLARQRLTGHANIHLLGRRQFSTLPSYLHNSDVGLIPFDVAGHGDLVNGVHPLKLYEYLASGLPVVSAAWDEIAHLKSPAFLCRTHDEYIAATRRALSSAVDRNAAVSFAEQADWGHRLATLLTHLGLPS